MPDRSGRRTVLDNERSAGFLDRVTITIPASPAYLRVVRLVAAGLASRISFTVDDIEDLKIAVDELSAYLIGSQGRDGVLEVSFTLYDDRIEIAGAGVYESEYRIRTELTDFSRMILDTVADEAVLDQQDGIPAFSVVKGKR
jgi:serine/threonine-protein kinase RsbW